MKQLIKEKKQKAKAGASVLVHCSLLVIVITAGLRQLSRSIELSKGRLFPAISSQSGSANGEATASNKLLLSTAGSVVDSGTFSVLNICSSHEVSWSDAESRILLGDKVAGSIVQFRGEGVNVSDDECELALVSSEAPLVLWKSLDSSREATKASWLQVNTSSWSANFSRLTLFSKFSKREHFLSRYCRCSLFFSLLW